MNKNTKTKNTHILHTPVLATEVLALLRPAKGDSYLDLTAGYGGHAQMVLDRTHSDEAVLCDRDPEAVSVLRSNFKSSVPVLNDTFSAVCDLLLEQGRRFDMILADLGVSSPHLDKANRGFSVSKQGPLDMRMNQTLGLTAADIVNSASEAELVEILRTYGEEPKAKRIATRIIENRPIISTEHLADVVKQSYGYTKHHPAVRTFQALRIAVNNELGLLEQMLPKAVKLLAPGGRLGVITFHSLEDRIVKQFFAEHEQRGYEAEITVLTKKPITPSPEEIRSNPRARSAKLRGVVKK